MPSSLSLRAAVFQSTPSARRATAFRSIGSPPEKRFQSTPSARRATEDQDHFRLPLSISIHALREEGDRSTSTRWQPIPDFNPRPPRGGRPTEPLHGCAKQCNFNPRPPRGGRPCKQYHLNPFTKISIHALREEGDGRAACTACALQDFNPRPPRGGRRSSKVAGE